MATQTLFGPTVIPSGPWPTSIVCATFALSGSMRTTESPPPIATQTEPNPAATPRGSVPTSIVCCSTPLATTETVPSPEFATHSDPFATAMPFGFEPTSIGGSGLALTGLIRWIVPSSRFVTQSPPSPAASP